MQQRMQNLKKRVSTATGKCETIAHCSYFALVFKEAHGMYGYAALACLALIVLHFLTDTHGEG